jgi:hypothetical protein
MSNRTVSGFVFALVISVLVFSPALAQRFYDNPYGHPRYHDYGYRGYGPYNDYGYYHRPDHTARNVAIGAGIGAAVGLLASHHGHRYD